MELNPMKTTLKILLAVSVLSAVAAPAIAQSSAATSETTSVTIITPIAIAPVTPLSFGSVSVGPTAGTIVLGATGSATYTGGVAFATGTTAPTQAKFHVTGLTGQVFGITLAGTSLTSGALAPIPLTGLTNAGATTLIAAGNDITVGGTLTLAASQAAGTYNGTVTATVTYN
jgi:spore coat protein U-like protein